MATVKQIQDKLDKLDRDVQLSLAEVAKGIAGLRAIIEAGGMQSEDMAAIVAHIDAIDAAVAPLTVPVELPPATPVDPPADGGGDNGGGTPTDPPTT